MYVRTLNSFKLCFWFSFGIFMYNNKTFQIYYNKNIYIRLLISYLFAGLIEMLKIVLLNNEKFMHLFYRFIHYIYSLSKKSVHIEKIKKKKNLEKCIDF